MREIAEKLRDERKRKSMTQSKLAEKSGVMQCTISRFEQHKQSITLETLIQLSRTIKSEEFNEFILTFIKNKLNG